jgi:hypothetical protein
MMKKKSSKKSSKKKKSSGKPKYWGKVDKGALSKLILEGLVDITDTSIPNIDAIQEQYFPHRKRKNFHRNFRDFAAAWDLEESLKGARSE